MKFGKRVQILHNQVLKRFSKNNNNGSVMSGGDRANGWKGQRVQNAPLAHVDNSAAQEASKGDDTVSSYITRATASKIRAVCGPSLISTGYDPQKWLFKFSQTWFRELWN